MLFQVWLCHLKLENSEFNVVLVDDKENLITSVQKQLSFVNGIHYADHVHQKAMGADAGYAGSPWAKYVDNILLPLGYDKGARQVQLLLATYNQVLSLNGRRAASYCFDSCSQSTQVHILWQGVREQKSVDDIIGLLNH